MSKKKVAVSSSLAVFSGFLGTVGFLGWCCTLAGAAILSFFGLASLSTWLVYNNKWFFGVAIIFTVFAIYYYIKYKRAKTCAIKK